MTDSEEPAATGAAVSSLVVAIANELLDAKDELNRLDAVAGDGDLGLTVAVAATVLVELAPELPALPESDAIRRCGMEIARHAPSTFGTLAAFAMMAAARAAVGEDATSVERAAIYLETAARSVADRGKVATGDRTMLDALQPAAAAVRDAAGRGLPARTAAQSAAAAAFQGSRATAFMEAKVGRAGWLAERAAGHEDAGARLVALAFEAASRVFGLSGKPG